MHREKGNFIKCKLISIRTKNHRRSHTHAHFALKATDCYSTIYFHENDIHSKNHNNFCEPIIIVIVWLLLLLLLLVVVGSTERKKNSSKNSLRRFVNHLLSIVVSLSKNSTIFKLIIKFHEYIVAFTHSYRCDGGGLLPSSNSMYYTAVTC